MKKAFQTMLALVFVILITGSFAFAMGSVTSMGDFPYFSIGCLVMGGLTIVSLKHRYEKINLAEVVGSFALYAVLVSLFTVPIIEAIHSLVS